MSGTVRDVGDLADVGFSVRRAATFGRAGRRSSGRSRCSVSRSARRRCRFLPRGLSAAPARSRWRGPRHRASRGSAGRRRKPEADLPSRALRMIERNELFREVIRPVVVRAVCGERREACMCADTSAHEMIARGLRCGIGTSSARRAHSSFHGGIARPSERAVHLVGGNVQEAECDDFRGPPSAADPVHACVAVQETKGSDDIRLDERLR